MRPFITDSYSDWQNTPAWLGTPSNQRAADTCWPPMEDMGVDHGCLDVAMSQQLLNRSNDRATFQLVHDKRMAERVATDWSGDPCLTRTRKGSGVVFRSLWAVRVTAASIPSQSASRSVAPSPRHQTAAPAARWCGRPQVLTWCAGD